MYDNQADVSVLPRLNGNEPLPGYTKTQAEDLHGKAYGMIEEEGVRIGRIVGDYPYRHEGCDQIHYALKTEYKFADSWPLMEGLLVRSELEESHRAVLLKDNVGHRVEEQLKLAERPSEKLIEDVRLVLDGQQRFRAAFGQGISF